MTSGKNWTKSFTLSHLGGNSKEPKKTLLSRLGDYKEGLKKTILYLAGRTGEDPTLPCWKNWRRPDFTLQEELEKTRLYLAGRTGEDPTLPCRKDWRRPYFALQEELEKTLHLVGAEKWLRRTGWRRPHNSSHLSWKKTRRNRRRPIILEINDGKNWRRPFTLYQLGDRRTEENSLSCLSWEITRKNWIRSYFVLQEKLKTTRVWEITGGKNWRRHYLAWAEKWLRRTGWKRPLNSFHFIWEMTEKN